MAGLELDRFKKSIKKLNLSMQEAANMIGLSRTSLYNNLNKHPMDEDFLKIVFTVLKIDLYNIISSNTNKFIDENTNDENHSIVNEKQANYKLNKNQNYSNISGNNTYYIPVSKITEFINSTPSLNMLDQFQLIKLPPEFNSINYIFQVEGENMYPTFSNGDNVGCRYMENKKYIQYGDPHLVDIGNGGLLFRRLFPVETKPDNIILRSDNIGYPDMEIEKNDITHLFLVTAKLSKNVGERYFEKKLITMFTSLEPLLNQIINQKAS